jgi:UMF1 family MFS transporter
MVAWALFDWANSPFTTLIVTFVFAAYFSRGIVGDPAQGQALWGYAIGISAAVVAVLSPVLGAIADSGGRRKPWIFVFTAVCVVASALLWFATPVPASVPLAMGLVIVATIGFEFGIVFNNAMLGDLVDSRHVGRWSGWAWGIGYFGGLAALVTMLFGFVQTDRPLFGIGTEEAANIRVAGPLVAVWFAVFVIPLFLFTPDRAASGVPAGRMVAAGVRALAATLRNVRSHANVARFLVARMIYNDGLATVFAIGGVYAAGRFGLSEAELIQFGILLNVTAGIGAIAFAWIDDLRGSRLAILVSLVGLTASGAGAVAATEPLWFWVSGGILGIFVGPAQAASRSFMTRLSPPHLRTEFFGLYALSGKATAFIGPFVAGAVTASTGSTSLGLASAVAFFVVGLVILLWVREPGRD